MAVPSGAAERVVSDGVLVATMVIELAILLLVGTWNEKAALEPFFRVYHLPLVNDAVLLVTPVRLLPDSSPPMATTLPPVM